LRLFGSGSALFSKASSVRIVLPEELFNHALRNGVVAPLGEGIAAEDPPGGEEGGFEESELPVAFQGVVGTTGEKPATFVGILGQSLILFY
jgi:hypothetical protein